MKQITFFLVALLMGLSGLKAQTNIGSPNAPDASAQLQISSTTLGVMMPKVSLTATTTFTLAGNTQTEGMVVYNTNAGITGTAAYPAYGTGLYTWDGTGWKGTPATAAMPKFFYMPSIIVPTSAAQLTAYGAVANESFVDATRTGTLNLYLRYSNQFGGATLIKSSASAPALPVLPVSALNYYVTWFDPQVFNTVSLDVNGLMTYTVKANADVTVGSFMNIVFAVK